MKMQIVFEGESMQALRSQVIDLAKTFGYEPAQTEFPIAQAPVVTPSAVTETPEQKEKKKPGPKPKVQAVAEAKVERPVDPNKPAPTKDSVKAALNEVVEKAGLDKAKVILAKYQAAYFSQLSEADYDAVLDECAQVHLSV